MKYSSLQIVFVAAIGMIPMSAQAGETQAEADFHAAQIRCNQQTGESRAACFHEAEQARDRALNNVRNGAQRHRSMGGDAAMSNLPSAKESSTKPENAGNDSANK